MKNHFDISNFFRTFGEWIGRSCKPSDKGKLTAFPHFTFCQQKRKNVSTMLRFEELPEVNSERWLSLEDFEGEEWKPVKGFEKYYHISNYGRLKSLRRWQNHKTGNMWRNEKIRKVSFDIGGYQRCELRNDTVKKNYFLFRLVAEAFIPNPENKPQVDHINTIRKDNRTVNLRWVTAKENARNPLTAQRVRELRNAKIGTHYSEETRRKISESLRNGKSSGFRMKGELHYRSKPILQFTLDGQFVKEWVNATEAAKQHGRHVSHCARGLRKTCGGYKWKYKEDFKKEFGL